MKRLGLSVLVLLAACSGGSGDDATPADGGSAPAGDGLQVGDDVTVTVHAVVDPVQVEVPEDLAQDIRNPVDPGTRWVAIDLEYFNHSDEVVDKTLAYAVELRTDDGREAVGVVPSFTVPDMPEVPKTIPSNGSARGWVVYEVPDGAEPATLLLYGKLGEEPAEVEL